MKKNTVVAMFVVALALIAAGIFFITRRQEKEDLADEITAAVMATLQVPEETTKTSREEAIPTQTPYKPCHPYFPITNSHAIKFVVTRTVKGEAGKREDVESEVVVAYVQDEFRRYQAPFIETPNGVLNIYCGEQEAVINGTRLPIDEGSLAAWRKTEEDFCNVTIGKDGKQLLLQCPEALYVFEKNVGFAAYKSETVEAQRVER